MSNVTNTVESSFVHFFQSQFSMKHGALQYSLCPFNITLLIDLSCITLLLPQRMSYLKLTYFNCISYKYSTIISGICIWYLVSYKCLCYSTDLGPDEGWQQWWRGASGHHHQGWSRASSIPSQ